MLASLLDHRGRDSCILKSILSSPRSCNRRYDPSLTREGDSVRRGLSVVRTGVLVALIALGLQVVVGSAASAAYGPGTLSLPATTVVAGSTGNTFTFTYTANSAGLEKGTLKATIPSGWSAPHQKKPHQPGEVTASSGTISVSGMAVSITNLTVCGSCSATVSYDDAKAPSATGLEGFPAWAATKGQKLGRLIDPPEVSVGAAPAAPTITLITPGIGELTVWWSAVDAYPDLWGYTVSCGEDTQTTSATTATFDGLTGGSPVTCSVYATNAIGNGPASAPVSATPELEPFGPPAVTSVIPGNGQLTVDYTAPQIGDGPLESYTAACGSNSTTVDGATLTATITGLTNGTDYSCTLVATGEDGNGQVSSWDGQPGPPTAPTITSVVPQDGQLTILFAPVSSDEWPTSYTGKCGSKSTTVNQNTKWITIGGLTDGTSYSCKVTASNEVGTGPASTSSSGTPAATGSATTSSSGGEFMGVRRPDNRVCCRGCRWYVPAERIDRGIEQRRLNVHERARPHRDAASASVTCLSAQQCLAVGSNSVLLTSDGGTTWSSEYAGGLLSSVACSSSSNCVAVGWTSGFGPGYAVMTSDGGLTWQETSGYTPNLEDVACLPSSCVGVGSGLARTTDQGNTWQLSTVAGGVQALTSVACLPSSTTCVGVGPNAQAVITTDDGQTWTNISSQFPSASDTLRSISCPTSQICYSTGYVGYTGAYTSNGGQSWTSINGPTNVTPPPREPLSPGSNEGGDLSCSAASTCVMVGHNQSGPAAASTTNGASTWTGATAIG